MISGEFVDGRVVLPVNFCFLDETNLIINFVVDTGFNNHLTLPLQAVIAMNLPFYNRTEAKLADGSEVLIPVYAARINWDGQEKVVLVLATGTKPLLGTALLQGFRLTIDFEPDGLVRLQNLPDR
jgi:clan AA aspartic protease